MAFMASWGNIDAEKQTLCVLTAKLSQQEKLMNRFKQKGDAIACMAGAKKKKNKCYNCGEEGHFKRDRKQPVKKEESDIDETSEKTVAI